MITIPTFSVVVLVDVKAWGTVVVFHAEKLSQHIHMGVTFGTQDVQ
jgi:hypothetical protein